MTIWCRGIRGATTCDENSREAILAATREMLQLLIAANGLRPEDLASAIFTTTPDLNAEFPAVAARRIGLSKVPLICAREMEVPGSLPRVIRLMLHCYASEDTEPQHVYLREAVSLRTDLQGAQ
jgi:chorismate mutase